jgi:peptide/nickel transport system substrate-binding protein
MGPQFDRRSFLVRSAAIASGLVVASEVVGSGVDPAGAVVTNGAGLNGLSTAKPRRGGNLVIGVDAEEQGFNPATTRFDTAGFMYGRTVFDPLMMVTATGQVVPYLAQSVTPNANYTVWTVTVRQGIKFHDGTPLNGAALFQNIDAVYKSLLTGIALQPLIASYAQSGPYSVAITMKAPWVTFPFTLAEQQVCFVVAPSMLNAPNGGTNNPVGTGPFKFQEWVPNSHFTAVANPDYWRPNQPYLDSVTFKPIPDAGARAEALQSGSVDMIHLSEPQQILQFRGNKSYAYVDNSGKMVGSPNVNCLMLNCAKPPFNDPDARRAVAMGTNRIQYARIIDQNVNAPATGIYQPGSAYYAKTSYPAYNPAGAKALVKKVQQKTGQPFAFTMNSVAAPYTVRIAAYTQQQLQNIGVKVTIAPLEQNELINDALSGDFEATEWSQFGGMSPDLNYVWFSTKTANPNGLSINMARNVDPRIEAALQTGMQSASQATRIAAFRQVNELLGQDIPYVWTDRIVWALTSKPTVRNWNYQTSPSGVPALGNDQGIWWLNQMWLA